LGFSKLTILGYWGQLFLEELFLEGLLAISSISIIIQNIYQYIQINTGDSYSLFKIYRKK
jgi:hypothetical protein